MPRKDNPADQLTSYFNLGMHHVPNTADLPNTVFTVSLVPTPSALTRLAYCCRVQSDVHN